MSQQKPKKILHELKRSSFLGGRNVYNCILLYTQWSAVYCSACCRQCSRTRTVQVVRLRLPTFDRQRRPVIHWPRWYLTVRAVHDAQKSPCDRARGGARGRRKSRDVGDRRTPELMTSRQVRRLNLARPPAPATSNSISRRLFCARKTKRRVYAENRTACDCARNGSVSKYRPDGHDLRHNMHEQSFYGLFWEGPQHWGWTAVDFFPPLFPRICPHRTITGLGFLDFCIELAQHPSLTVRRIAADKSECRSFQPSVNRQSEVPLSWCSRQIFFLMILSRRERPPNGRMCIQPFSQKNMCAFVAAVSITVTFVFWSIFPEITPG